jgi:uncharacterized protein YhbP (UPF0306 family)
MMTNQQIEQTIRDYIPQIIHMSLATVRDNKPWVCEVHFSYDDDLNLYFVSSSETRHAKDIVDNQFVAGNIVTQHHKNQKVRCVDFEGHAQILSSVEAEQTAYKAYAQRYGTSEGLLNEIRKDGNTRFFKIAVKDFFLFDSYEGERSKYHLPWNKEQS